MKRRESQSPQRGGPPARSGADVEGGGEDSLRGVVLVAAAVERKRTAPLDLREQGGSGEVGRHTTDEGAHPFIDAARRKSEGGGEGTMQAEEHRTTWDVFASAITATRVSWVTGSGSDWKSVSTAAAAAAAECVSSASTAASLRLAKSAARPASVALSSEMRPAPEKTDCRSKRIVLYSVRALSCWKKTEPDHPRGAWNGESALVFLGFSTGLGKEGALRGAWAHRFLCDALHKVARGHRGRRGNEHVALEGE